MYRHIAKVHVVCLESNNDQCYIQNRVVMNHVIKRYRCNLLFRIQNKQTFKTQTKQSHNSLKNTLNASNLSERK